MSEKQIETVVVTYEQFSDWEFNPPGSYFIRISTGDFIFYKTADRLKAQVQIDLDFPPKGKYTAIPVKISKTKSKLESGDLSCRGTATMRGQKK